MWLFSIAVMYCTKRDPCKVKRPVLETLPTQKYIN